MRLGEPGGEARYGGARFDPELMRAVERRRHPGERREARPRHRRLEQFAGLAHFGFAERFEHVCRLATAGGDHQPAVDDLDAGRAGDLGPYVARAHGPVPAFPTLLPGHRDEAEIAHGGAVGLSVAIDDHDLLAAPRRRKRMGEPANAGANYGQIETAHLGHARCLMGGTVSKTIA